MPSLPLPEVLHVIVRKPYSDVSGLYQWIKQNSSDSLIGQHDADDEIENTHCHIQIKKFKMTIQSIRDHLKTAGLGGRGNYNVLTETQRDKKPYDEHLLNIYILKGSYLTHRSSTYTIEQIQAYIEKWTAYIPIDGKDASGNVVPIKKKKEKPQNHWEIIEEIIKLANLKPGWWRTTLERDEDSNLVNVSTLTDEGRYGMFDLMCKQLQIHKVRTSRNELERFYVSILRFDKGSRENLREAIIKNVFRTP